MAQTQTVPQNRDRAASSLPAKLLDPNFMEQVAMAVPSVVKPERIVRILLTAWRKDHKLQKCTHASLLEVCMLSAQTGLEIGTGLAHAVPYWNKRLGSYEAQFQVDYKGITQQLYRSGMVKVATGKVLYEGDEFDENLGEKPIYKKGPNVGVRDKITGAFATIGLRHGGWVTVEMSLDELHRHRDQYSQAAAKDKTSPWWTSPEPMYVKTCLRQAAKFAPVSSELTLAIAADEFAEQGRSQLELMRASDGAFEVATSVPESASEQLRQQLEKKRAADSQATGEGEEIADAEIVEEGEETPDDRAAARKMVLEMELEANLDPERCKTVRQRWFEISDDRGMTLERWREVVDRWDDYVHAAVPAGGDTDEPPPLEDIPGLT